MNTEETEAQKLSQLSSEVLNNLEELLEAINRVEDPRLEEVTRKWRHEKGVPNLIRTLVKVDHLISTHFSKPKTLQKKMPVISENRCNENGSTQGRIKVESIFANQQCPNLTKFPPLAQNTMLKNNVFRPTNFHQQPFSENFCLKLKEQGEQKIDTENQNQIKYENPIARRIIVKKESEDKKSYIRGPYKSYTKELKERAVAMHEEEGVSITKISKNFGIPIKNIKRWCEQGVERKEGAGRKRLDPSMENELYNKIIEQQPDGGALSVEQIRTIALELSTIPDFKASRGWIINFAERYNLNEKFTLY